VSAVDDYDAIAQTVQLYIDGAAQGDMAKLQRAFHPDARMFGAVGGQRVDIPIAELIALSGKHPANSAGNYRGRLTQVIQVGDAAVATVSEDGFWGSVSFVDFLSLARIDGNWKIVNKTFAHTGGEPPPL
jgi:hypothetical protein